MQCAREVAYGDDLMAEFGFEPDSRIGGKLTYDSSAEGDISPAV